MQIKPLSSEHIAELLTIEAQSDFPNWDAEQFQHEFSNRSAIVWGAFLGEGVVAYLIVRKIIDELQVIDIATHRDFRRQGLAKNLLLVALEDARQSGLQVALLEVRISNEPGHGLYKALGFKQYGVRHGYYRNGDDALLFRLELNKHAI